MKNAFKICFSVLRYLGLSVCVFVIVFNLYSFAAGKLFGMQMPSIFGFSYAVVTTGSMEPEIKAGEFVLAHKQNEYKAGDVCSYKGVSIPVTHRVMEVTRDNDGKITHYITAGDANFNEKNELVYDGEISADRFIGKIIFHSRWIGDAIGFIRTPYGTVLIILFGAGIYFVSQFLNDRKTNGGYF